MDEREYEENELYEEIPEDDPVNNNEDEYGAGEDEASGAYDFDIPSQQADYSDEFEDEEDMGSSFGGVSDHSDDFDDDDDFVYDDHDYDDHDNEGFDSDESAGTSLEKEYTVSTQGFYEQYGDEIMASVRHVDDEEIYSEVEQREDVDEADYEYQFPKKKRKKKHYLFKLMILLIVACAVFAIAMSPLFNIKNIVVEGEHKYKEEEIIKASGVKTGQNIFRVSESDVEKALKKDAYFSAVSISRKLPGQLTIRVSERREAAYIKYGRSRIIIDASGYVLRKTDRKVKLTELQNLKIKSMEIGKKLETAEETAFNKTLEVIGSMGEADIFFKKIVVKKVILRAYIYNDFLCKGKPDNLIKNMKNGNLKSVIKDLRRKGKYKGTITLGDDNYCSYSPKVQ